MSEAKFLISILFFATSVATANIAIPANPNSQIRESINRNLGFEFSAMPLGSYKPLGGYPGLEIGMDFHHIDLSELNNKNYVRNESNLDFVALTVSKGLYYDVDVRFTASFLPQTQSLQYYSGLVRWKFAEIPKWFRLTAEGSVSGVNMTTSVTVPTAVVQKSSYSMQGTGFNLVASKSVGRFEVFVGGGTAYSKSYFIVKGERIGGDFVPQEDSSNRVIAGGGYDWGGGKVTGGIDYIQQTKVFVQTQFVLF